MTVYFSAVAICAAGLHVGMAGAVKARVKELDKKVAGARNAINNNYSTDISRADIPGSGPVVFYSAPLALSGYDRIVPLGHLSPPAHTVPSDHIYFVLNNSSIAQNVICPADGYLTVIRKDGATDYALTIYFTGTFKGQFGHMTSVDAALYSSGLVSGDNNTRVQVSSGQVLGTVGGFGMNGACLDFGVYDNDVTLNFISPYRYPAQYAHAVYPVSYFDPAISAGIAAKLDHIGVTAGGKTDFDQAGKLAGNWFYESFNTSNESVGWTQQVAFVYDCVIATRPLISTGGQVMNNVSGSFSFQSGAVLPENVTPLTGKVVYQLYMTTEGGSPNPSQYGTLIVQMVNDNRIKIQGTTNTSATDFDPGAAVYYYIR